MTEMTAEGKEAVIRSITRQVTEKEGVAADALPPLYQAIDPTIFQYLSETATLEFQYFGYTIVVDGDRAVTVEDCTDDNRCAA